MEDPDPSVCGIKGCDKPSVALGLCVNHWRRNKKWGSPLARRHHSGMFAGLSAEERFWMRVKKGPQCWVWTGGRDEDGYGSFRGDWDGRTYQRAHRFSYAMHHGDPTGKHVCHTCDNPPCVNPAHLVLGTAQFNMADKIAKGRARVAFGEKAGSAVLTEQQALDIANDPRPYAQIAADYGVKASTVGSLKNGGSWRHLEPVVRKAKRVSPRKGVSDKITPEIVRHIRTSDERGKDLAERYGVTQATITDIRKRRSWVHIE